ncbi:MAG TPA: hypothetical protein VGI80_03990, partial [Pyrinomonadaceae bacterium]
MFFARIIIPFLFVLVLATVALGQRVAMLTPDDSDGSKAYAAKLEKALEGKVKLVDDALAKAAFDSAGFQSSYNLSLDEARNAGQAIGCDFFVLVRSDVQRQSSFEKAEYYDGYAFVFLVSAKTGRLVARPFVSEIGDKPEDALRKLNSTIPATADLLTETIRPATKAELGEASTPRMEEPPDEGSPAAKNFRAPVPFRRLKPEYTKLADRYEVTATVDISVDLDADGRVLRTEIKRWAGYDLDESVDKAVR